MTAGPGPWRRSAHDWSLIFCAAVGTYLISILLATRLSLWLSDAARDWESAAGRVALGVVALELSKLPGLLLAALLLGRALTTRPFAAALGLVVMTYGFEVIVSAILDQTAWLLGPAAVLACRAVAAALLVLLTALVLRRRRRVPTHPQ
jgi:uncharacterized membrane protein YdcZ (DUF606 family)